MTVKEGTKEHVHISRFGVETVYVHVGNFTWTLFTSVARV